MIDKNKIKSILVVRTDRFGEFLLNIPAFRALKEAYPQARLTLAVSKDVVKLAECIKYVDKVAIWDDDIRKNLRKQRFDACVVFNPKKEAHWAVFISGIPVRVGYDRKWGFLLTHKIKDTKHLGKRHEVECNLELVRLIEAKAQNKEIASSGLRLPRNDKYDFLTGAIAIHPFTSDPVKQWPVERFRELAQRITEDRGQSPTGTVPSKVVLVGKIEDRGQSSSGTGPLEAIDLINKTSLVELAQILKQCRLLVTCDSGPMHLAVAVGTPVVALFRNDLPGKTARRWGPWGEGHTVIEKSNLNDITVEEVLGIVRNKLQGQSPAKTVPSVENKI